MLICNPPDMWSSSVHFSLTVRWVPFVRNSFGCIWEDEGRRKEEGTESSVSSLLLIYMSHTILPLA